MSKIVIQKTLDDLRSRSNTFAKERQNEFTITRSNGYTNSCYLTYVNNKTAIIGAIDHILSFGVLKDLCCVLKQFGLTNIIIDHKNSSEYVKKQLPKDSYTTKPYKSTNSSNMNITHIDLKKAIK